MRPRLALLADLAADLGAAVRTRLRPGSKPGVDSPRDREERRSAEEIKRRLDETRARLKTEKPPLTD